jgi:predicted ATPase/DNA-binding winged helix-turn-helix (wHTH) protein
VSDARPNLVYACEQWEIDLGRRELRAAGTPVPLGSRAFEIVEVLVRSASSLVTKDELMQQVWPGTTVGEATLHVHISAVRKALGRDRHLVKTAQGRGYRLLGGWAAQEQASKNLPPVLQHRRVSAAFPPTNFSPLVARLFGRSEAVRRVRDLISAYRVVTLTGPGGIGKTVLATEAVRGLMADFDGAGLVELASLSDPDLVPTAVASVLGLRLSGKEISAQAVAEAVGETRLLLILDNCEHVIDAAANFVETFVRMCPRIAILATSREILRTSGEYVYRVLPLEVPAADEKELDQILGHSAVELFVARALALDYSPNGDALLHIADICRRLDGIPLAIEFAAARTATLGIEYVATGLNDRFALLTSGRRTALPRHRTLRATLDWSYELLPTGEAGVLGQLAVFAGDFSLRAAAAVVGETPISVADDIANLAAKSLIVAESHDSIVHYHLLETVRLYALEKARNVGDARRRHAEFYHALFLSAEADSETQTEAEWLAAYGWHLDNIRQALGWAFSVDGDLKLGIALTVVAVPLWIVLSLLEECRGWVGQALAALPSTPAQDARLEMRLQVALGQSLRFGTGTIADEAAAAWTNALEIAERRGDTEYQLRSLQGLWFFHSSAFRHRTALAVAQRFQSLASGRSRPAARRMLGISHHYLGDQATARRYLEYVLASYEARDHGTDITRFEIDSGVMARLFMARILWLTGFPDQAMRTAEHAVEDAHATKHTSSLAQVLAIAACPTALRAGQLAAAEHYNMMLLDLAKPHGLTLWSAFGRGYYGVLAVERGDAEAGLRLMRASFDELGSTSSAAMLQTVALLMADALLRCGRIREGRATVEQAIVWNHPDSIWLLPELRRLESELVLLPHAPAAAERQLREALALARQQGASSWELRVATSLARLLHDQHRHAEAKDILGPICKQFTEGFDTADLKAAMTLLDAL